MQHLLVLLAGVAALSLRTPPSEEAPEFDYGTGEAVPDEKTGEGYEQALEDYVHDEFNDVNPESMADPDECTEDMIATCKDLWEKRLEDCKANQEKWAGMCEPPRFTDPATGKVRNCMTGQCSPIYKDVYEHKKEVQATCAQFEGQPLTQVSCGLCEEEFPDHILGCMSCGEHCMERHCEDPASHKCIGNSDMRSCLKACVHESLQAVCAHYEGALEVSCHMCEQFYPRKAMECMTCSTDCAKKLCETPDSDECLFSKEVGTCHGTCMEEYKKDPEKADELCAKFEDAVEQESCTVCEKKFPRHVIECMDCETHCLEDHCSGEEDMDACAGLSVTRTCHKHCMSKHTEEICGHFKENPVALEACGVCANKYNSRVLECMECGSDCLKEMCSKDEDPHQCMRSDGFETCHEPCMKNGFEATLEKLKNQLVQRQQHVWRRIARRARRMRGH